MRVKNIEVLSNILTTSNSWKDLLQDIVSIYVHVLRIFTTVHDLEVLAVQPILLATVGLVHFYLLQTNIYFCGHERQHPSEI